MIRPRENLYRALNSSGIPFARELILSRASPWCWERFRRLYRPSSDSVAIPCRIPGFPTSTAEGHAGRLVVGKVSDIPYWRCRAEFTITDTPEQVTFRAYVWDAWHQNLVLTNAAGGISNDLSQGALMVIAIT